jgi:hypothetical protein
MGDSATTEGVADTDFDTEVDRDKTVIPGLVVEASVPLLVLVAPTSKVEDAGEEDVDAAAAALADLDAAKTDAEGVANGVLTLTPGDGLATELLVVVVVVVAGAGNVVNVGFDRLDKLNTFAFRLMGGWTGGAGGLVAQ